VLRFLHLLQETLATPKRAKERIRSGLSTHVNAQFMRKSNGVLAPGMALLPNPPWIPDEDHLTHREFPESSGADERRFTTSVTAARTGDGHIVHRSLCKMRVAVVTNGGLQDVSLVVYGRLGAFKSLEVIRPFQNGPFDERRKLNFPGPAGSHLGAKALIDRSAHRRRGAGEGNQPVAVSTEPCSRQVL
jgi:hypothetical protein